MDIGQLKYLSETCCRSCHMSLVGGDTFLASQRREMLVPDWLDLYTADKVDQPLLTRKPGAASQQINLGGGGRGCLVRLASPWRSRRPQTLSLAGFHSSSGWQLPPRAPVGPETRGERATTVGVLAAERGQALRLLLALAQVRMGRREEREDERMTTSPSKSSHSRNNQKMQDFTVCHCFLL